MQKMSSKWANTVHIYIYTCKHKNEKVTVYLDLCFSRIHAKKQLRLTWGSWVDFLSLCMYVWQTDRQSGCVSVINYVDMRFLCMCNKHTIAEADLTIMRDVCVNMYICTHIIHAYTYVYIITHRYAAFVDVALCIVSAQIHSYIHACMHTVS
jgi:hypothetical protein